jgi:GLPGLI family protein
MYIKLCISIILATLFTTNSYAQHFNYYRGINNKQVIDTCVYAVTYTFKYLQDTIQKTPCYDKQVLETGNKYIHYGSVYAAQLDSIWDNYVNNPKAHRQHKGGGDGINRERELGLKLNEKSTYEDYYINYPDRGNLMVTMAIELMEYQYSEPVPKQVWIPSADTATILGYKCLKATTTFRGRTYNAWFTPQVPIRQGPWKFSGLPGLILKINDTEGYFEWTAIGIERPPNSYIYVHKLAKKKVVITSRENVQKIQRKLWDDPAGLMLSQGSAVGTKVHFMTKDRKPATNLETFRKPYIPPLELE